MTNPNDAPPIDPQLVAASTGQRPTKFRWVICALLFYATTVNYMDRSIFGVLSADLQKIIGWSDSQFGYINAAFTLAYALGFIFMGRLIDKVGTRVGYTIAIFLWSLAGIGTAFARTAFGFGVARFALGLGESGNFPAAIKTVAEWFPQRQRSTATGVFNAGSNVGAIAAPLLVPFIVLGVGAYLYNQSSAAATMSASVVKTIELTRHGWPAAFFITPTLALIWIVLWLFFYRTPGQSKFANDAERTLIDADSPVPYTGKRVRWIELIPHRQTWAFVIGKFLTDAIWWFYLFWSPKFLSDTFHVNIKTIGPPLIVIYVMADIGSIGGGWLPSLFLRMKTTPNFARKVSMLICALAVVPVAFAPTVSNEWTAVFLIGIATAAHQGFSANLFTLTSDMFPKHAVASVVGLGGFAGGIGGMIMQAATGATKQGTGSYLPMFIVAASVYLLAVPIVHFLAPRLKPVTLSEAPSATTIV